MAAVHILCRPRSSQTKTAPLPVDLRATDTLSALRKEIASAWGLSATRQRLTLEGSKQPLEGDDKTLKDLGLSGKAVVLVKDLGPQIGWKTTFVIEYAGPLFIHPLFYYKGHEVYSLLQYVAPKALLSQWDSLTHFEHSKAQTLTFILIMLHFAKRELETLFVHRFSRGSMALWRLFLNSGHYWGVSGLLLAATQYGPWNSAKAVKGSLRDDDLFLGVMTAIWVFAQLSNGYSHIQLANLRPKGTTKRAIPYGYGFNLVSCPNYTFEILAWLAILGITQSWTAAGFNAATIFILIKWGTQKHRKYKKEFGKEYPRRKVVIPFLI